MNLHANVDRNPEWKLSGTQLYLRDVINAAAARTMQLIQKMFVPYSCLMVYFFERQCLLENKITSMVPVGRIMEMILQKRLKNAQTN